MANLFLLHEPNNVKLADQLEAFLKRNGYQVTNRVSIRPGQNISQSVGETIRSADGVIILIDSGTGSDFFREEVTIAVNVHGSRRVVVLMKGNESLKNMPSNLAPIQRFVIDAKHSLQSQAVLIDQYFKKWLAGDSTTTVTGQPVPSSTGDSAFWLIKINDRTWPIADFQIGQGYTFNSRHHENERQEDAALFEQLKVNDRLLAYAYSEINAVIAVFRVTSHDIILNPEDNVIGLEVDALIEPYINDEELSRQGFTAHHISHETNKLFALDGEFVSRMLNSRSLKGTASTPPGDATLLKLLTQQAAVTSMSNDVPDASIPDKLDIMDDVRAMAMVIAYEKVKPPISIGLFGNWGSGKSFFMLKLEREINELVAKQVSPFNTKVVSIRFNSWHYSDANLWASLITRIFEGLKAHGGSKDSELETLFKNLSSTTELIEETEQREKAIVDQIADINTRAAKLETTITEKAKRLSGMSLRAIATAVFQDAKVKEDINAIRKEFDYVDLSTYEQIGKKVNELEHFGSQTIKTVQLAYDFRQRKTFFMLIVAAVVFGLAYFAADLGLILKPWYKKVEGYAALLLAALTQVATLIAPAGKKIAGLHQRLVGLKAKMEELREQKVKEFEGEKEKLKSELIAAETEQKELAVQRAQLESRKAELSLELEDIRTGKKLQSFIESRVTDERYQNNLGIISWIRKDFEKLDFLLKQQHDPKLLKLSGQKKVDNIFRIDRIVLYIDDLDRCDTGIVVQVLEAIHLLLAFPLFVVVVGVDPRWMNNALRGRFQQLGGGDIENGKPEAEGKTTDNLPVKLPITSQAYLEKIFQIPFVLKPMSEEAIGDLIGAQFAIPETSEDENIYSEEDEISDENNNEEAAELNDPEAPDLGIAVFLPNPVDPGGEAEDAGASTDNPPREEAAQSNNQTVSQQALDLLVLAPEEITFMQTLGSLAGDSPRTIVRFVNIYRIIRSHADLVFEEASRNEHYYAVMVVLSALTGPHAEGKLFLKGLKTAAPGITFKAYSDGLQKAKMTKDSYGSILKGTAAEAVMKQIGGVKLSVFQANLDLVCRFSFHVN